jgi:hypothetical protein
MSAEAAPKRELSEREMDIIARHGIPPVCAMNLLEQSKQGFMTSARGNDSDHPPTSRYLDEGAPKPSTVKAKTGNWGLTKGVISVEEVLSKIEQDDGKWKFKPRDGHDVPHDQPFLINKISLQEVIGSIQKSEYELESITENSINFKIKKDVPDDAKELIFRLNLEKFKLPPPLPTDRNNITVTAPPSFDKPEWWKDEVMGKYEDMKENYFETQYKNPQVNEEFKDILIYGCPDDKGRVIPITGDLDQFISGVNVDFISKVLEKCPDALKELNTFKEDGRLEMVQARIDLVKAVYEVQNDGKKLEGKPLADAINNILSSNLAREGIITPIESYMNNDNNKSFNISLAHIKDLFQHGCESRNPGKQSPMGNVVFFISGEMHEVKGPKEVSDLLLTKALPNHTFDVNPKWDMQYFGPIVKEQIRLGHRVLPSVLNAYNEFNLKVGALPPREKIIEPPKDSYTTLKENAHAKEAVFVEKSTHGEVEPAEPYHARRFK